MISEEDIISHYAQKVEELNNLLDGGMINQAEYEELVQDFTDVETIREDINEESMKIMAAKVVDAISKLIRIF
jgi:demethoxyubiquinone hydroxylase (CLK1/Coq7/Cat5 family)